VIPEVTIEKVDDDYIMRFEDDGMPHLRINRTYRQMMESKDSSRRLGLHQGAVSIGRRFVEELEHRRQTIYRVASRSSIGSVTPRSWHRALEADDAKGRGRRYRHASQHRSRVVNRSM